MNKKKLLSALVMSSLVSTMSFIPNNSANAQTDIYLNGTGQGGNNTWANASASTSYLHAYDPENEDSDNYTHWVGDDLDDTLTMTGGTLTTSGLTQNAYLYATDGTINVQSGQLDIYGNSSIGTNVDLTVSSGATLNMGSSTGSVVLSSNDSLNGYLNATAGSLNISSGTHNMKNGSTIANAVNLSVGSNATLGITGGNVTIGSGDTISGAINNSSGTLNVNSNMSVGSLTNSNTSNTAVVLGNNTLTLTNGLTNTGTLGSNNTGSVITNGSSSNTGNVSVNSFTVASGSLTNSGNGAIDANTYTVNQGATLNNSANIGAQGDSLNTFTNNGTTTNSGNIYSNTVTNNDSLTNSSNGTITATDVVNNGATLTNSGTINTGSYTNQKNGNAEATTTNNGTLNATTLNNNTNFVNSSTGEVDANTINNTAGIFTNQGTVGATNSLNTINNSAGAKFVNENTVHASTVSNNGEYQNSTATSVLNATRFDNNANASFINNGASTIGTLNNYSSITGNNGSLTVSNGGVSSGSIVQGTIELTAGNFDNTGSITSNTTFSNGAIITDTTGHGTLSVKKATFGANVTQDKITISDEATNENSKIIATSELNVTETGSLIGKEIEAAGGTNAGEITQETISITGAYTNNGDMTSSVNFSNTGAITGGEGSSLTVNNATFGANITQDTLTINGAAVNAESTIDVTKLDVESNASLTGLHGVLLMDNGTNDGEITQEDITISGDYVNNNTMTSTGTFTNTGNITGDEDSSLTVTDGTNSGSIQQHSITVNNDADEAGFVNQSTGSIIADEITNNGDLTNQGVIAGAVTMDGNTPVYSAGDLAITNATGADFTNATTGTIVANSIANSGDFTNNGTSANAITTDTLTNNATGDESFENNGNLVVLGDVDGENNPIGLTNSGNFENTSTGEIIANAIDNTVDGNFVGNFTNAGAIAGGKDDQGNYIAGDLAITNANGATFTNEEEGRIFADSITNEGTASNAGAIIANTVANDAGTFTNTGIIAGAVDGDDEDEYLDKGNLAITNASGAEFTNEEEGKIFAHSVANEGTASNEGYIITDSIANNAGTFTNTGHIGGDIEVDGDDEYIVSGELAITNASGADFTNGATGTIIADSIANSGDFTNNGTSANAITTNTLTNDATGDESFENNGNLVVLGDVDGENNPIGLTNSGIFNNNEYGDILATVIDNEATGVFTNNGDIAAVENEELAITNASGADFTNTTNGTIIANSISNSGDFTNNNQTDAGAITTDTLTNDATDGESFINNGNLVVLGDVDEEQNPIGLTNSGDFVNTTNGDIIANVIDNKAGGDFTNAGSIEGGVDDEGNPVQGNLAITNAQGAEFTNEATGSILAKTITNDGDMYNEYTNENTKGSIVADTITNSSTGTLTNDGDITANSMFTNDNIVNNSDEGQGTLNVKDGTNTGSITQGTMNIAEGGIFTNNNAITIQDELNNNGTLNNFVAEVEEPEVAPVPNITVQNSTNDAVLNNIGTINSVGASADDPALITADKLVNALKDEEGNVITNGVINLTNTKMAVVYQAGDIGGVINVFGESPDDKSELSITGDQPNFAGALNVGTDSEGNDSPATLTLTAGNILEDANVDIASGSVLNVAATPIFDEDTDEQIGEEPTSLVLNEDDTYEGDLVLNAGDVTMKNVDYVVGKDSTTSDEYDPETGRPYYAQDGGSLTLDNATLTMEDSSLINGGDLTVDPDSEFISEANGFIVDDLENAGLIEAINGGYEDYVVNDTLYAGSSEDMNDNQGDFSIDLYARSNNNKDNDTFGGGLITAANGEDGILNISDWELNGDIFGYDAPIDGSIDLGQIFKGQVDETVTFTATDKKVFTPIGWYGLNSNGGGNYSFDLAKFNPGVFRGQVTKIAQYQNQLMIDDMIFNHTMLDQGFKGNDYMSLGNANKYAYAGGGLYPPYQYSQKDGGLWLKMYGTFEKLNMNHNLSVGNNAYGTIIGGDFGLKELRNDWKFMPTAYVAYNGAHQYWKGYGAYQNGGQLGFLGTWYKDDFMIGALAYGGLYNNNMSTPRGDDDSLGYFAGGSLKAAYNWKFAKDWSLQPNMLVAYNFFGKENWHSDFGQMGMMSGMLNGINIAPGVNLIWEKETFSIYGTLQYMYNINQYVGGRAGNVTLPHVHMDRGYIQYGVGVNKKFTDRFAGFFQAVLRNVGRTGIGLQAGFQWSLGKDGSHTMSDKAGKTPELKKTQVNLSSSKTNAGPTKSNTTPAKKVQVNLNSSMSNFSSMR